MRDLAIIVMPITILAVIVVGDAILRFAERHY